MTQLAIKLTGQIVSSNFDEWKAELISCIKSTSTELTTDAEFAEAAENVKQFKAAEQALKKAKQSAINQAADIQRLFSAIDEVSEEVRQVRLSLEHQIKVRKQEIREEVIQSGMDRVRDYIEEQDQDFQLIDHSDFLDRSIFESAVKERRTVEGLSVAVDDVCQKIRQQIASKAREVRNNANTLDSLPTGQRALFQDREALLSLASSELNVVIDERVETFLREVGGRGADDAEVDQEDEIGGEQIDDDEDQMEAEFSLVIELFAMQVYAEQLLQEIEATYADDPAVLRIRLVRK